MSVYAYVVLGPQTVTKFQSNFVEIHFASKTPPSNYVITKSELALVMIKYDKRNKKHHYNTVLHLSKINPKPTPAAAVSGARKRHKMYLSRVLLK